jgi:hypothetical protein
MSPRMGITPPGAKAPFCEDCGSLDCHVVERVAGSHGEFGHLWLCGSCEYLRANPDAPKQTVRPGLPSTWPHGRGKPQKERLF